MTAPKATPAKTRKAATTPVVTKPEADLTAIAAKAPSTVNVAEAAWLVQCAGLEVPASQMDLVAKVVQLVAGSAHRAWQHSAAAASVHATARANKPA